MKRLCWQVVVAIMIIATAGLIAASDLGTYRGFALGSAASDVMKLAGAGEPDLKTVHERPALLQELTWRPPYASGLDDADRDSVAAVVFSFVDNQLFRIAIDYDRSRTEGLTTNDVIAALTAKYGPPSAGRLPTSAVSGFHSIDAPTVVAVWRNADTTVTLEHFAYSRRFATIIASTRLQMLARKSQSAAVTMDAREAPAREAARVKARADAERAAAEKTRTANKATFEP